MIKRKHPITRNELLRMKHRALRMRRYRGLQRMSPRISTSIWQAPIMHSFSRPLSPINKEYVEAEERKEKKNMNWFQAKKAFPKLPLFGDADKDGIYNMFDCRPFNRNKQGPEHEQAIEDREIQNFGVSFNRRNRDKIKLNKNSDDSNEDAQSLIDSA